MSEDTLEEIVEQNTVRANVGTLTTCRGRNGGHFGKYRHQRGWKAQLRGLRAATSRRKDKEVLGLGKPK